MLTRILSICFLLMSTAALAQKNYIDQPYVEVSATGDTLITPDEIYITILISEKDTRDRIPLEQIETNMHSALESLGIDVKKDLAVKEMSSNFKYSFLKNTDVIKSRNYLLKVETAQTAGRVFTELEKLNISNSYITGVSHSKIEQIKNKMRSKAILLAKDKSVALGQPLGQQTGKVLHIEDKELQYRDPGGRSGNTITMLDGVMIRGSSGVVNAGGARSYNYADIDFRQIPVSITVSAKFTIE